MMQSMNGIVCEYNLQCLDSMTKIVFLLYLMSGTDYTPTLLFVIGFPVYSMFS